MDKKRNGNLALKSVWNGCRSTVSSIVCFYTVCILTVFLFYSTDRYFHILRDRTKFFWMATACMVSLSALVFLFFLLRYFKERDNEYLKTVDISRLHARNILAWLRRHMTAMDAFLLAYLSVCIISTICSEWPADAFWGTKGRYQGCFLWLWYGAAYFMVSRFYVPSMLHIKLFLVSGVALSLWGLTDYAGLDVFGWVQLMKEDQRGMFTAAIGNINTYTAMMSVFLAVSGANFIKKGESGCCLRDGAGMYFIMFFLFLLSLITGQSDNAAIGITAFFLIAPFLFLGRRHKDTQMNEGLQSYLALLGLFFLSFAAVFMINQIWNNPYIDASGGILLRICSRFPLQCLVFAVLVFSAAKAVGYYTHKLPVLKRDCPAAAVWVIILAISFGLLAIILWMANSMPEQVYEPLKKYLIVDDRWGTDRGLCWRLAVEQFKEFSVLQKLIGSGHETYGILVKSANYQEMLNIAGQVYDSPHNECLQHLVSTGVLGVISYYGFLTIGCIKGILSKNSGKSAAALGVAIYTCVSFVNISVPITQPFVIILIAFIIAEDKETIKEQKTSC